MEIMTTGLPEHLSEDLSFLQCNKCGRKSWDNKVNDLCGMIQPNNKSCNGTLEGKTINELSKKLNSRKCQ